MSYLTRGNVNLFIMVVISLLIGGVSAIAVFLMSAFFTSNILLVTAFATISLLLVTAGLTQWWFRQNAVKSRRRTILRVMGTTLLLTGICSSLFVFRPFDLPNIVKPQPAEMQFWTLFTGSRIAYQHLQPSQQRQPFPILFLHGGPGGSFTKAHSRVFKLLTEDGFDVYLYDQIGSGLSDRLPNLRDYTVARQVADLEAIRQQLGAEQIILIGQSWGSALAVHYIVSYPTRVARVVFSSPFAPWSPTAPTQSDSCVSNLHQWKILQLALSPRSLINTALLHINPAAARQFMSDREADSFMDRLLQLTESELFCRSNSVGGESQSYSGYYAWIMTGSDLQKVADPRVRLRMFSNPALILRSEFDYLNWQDASSYKQAVPQATLLYLKDAGHAAYQDQPKLYVAAIRAFLLDRPLPLLPYS